ncbi:uncharacterized protein LOC130636552 [Hydractinia symbiolongicarpus]|uniref:uncharacterized protein LOC130636552 n=1 Tax=Hydractinia symbiolongicarpus TaxID=13093 RepID=UPI0025512832|nr:uncharacterized protein LOC130636552 [Hydractinia symbiolongicarpus]
MTYYQVPSYAQGFVQSTALYPRPVVYPAGTVIAPPAPTVLAAGTTIIPSGGRIITPAPVVQTIQTVPGNTVFVQNPAPAVVVHYQNGSTASNLARSVGGAVASAMQSDVVQEAAKGFVNEMDRHAKSPLLDCFMRGSGIQLRSKAGGKMLRVLADGSVDCKGDIGNDYNAHFLVLERYENKVVLRNGENNAYHLKITDGLPSTSMTPAYLVLHETLDHYVTLRDQLSGQCFGVDANNNILPSQFVSALGDEAKFEVNLAYSPYGHTYEPRH